jgi:hypothetical protein
MAQVELENILGIIDKRRTQNSTGRPHSFIDYTTVGGLRAALVALRKFGPTSAAVTGTVGAVTTGSVALSWPAVPNAFAYRVYGRTGGSEALLAVIFGRNYTDTGADAPGIVVEPADSGLGTPKPAAVASDVGGSLGAGTYSYRVQAANQPYPIQRLNSMTKNDMLYALREVLDSEGI